MTRWQKLRIELLKDLYELYMSDHQGWVDFEGDDSHSLSDVTRELDYLVEKGWVRKQNGYQLTADGRDYFEENFVSLKTKPTMKIID